MTTYLKEDFLFDADLVLEDSLDANGDAAAITVSAAGSVLGDPQVIDLGDGLVEGYMIVDIDAIDVTTGEDQLYTIKLQGNNAAAFTAALVVDLAHLQLGCGTLLVNATAGTDIGAAGNRFVVPFRNEQNGTVYRYVRAYQLIADASSGESITDTIWLSIKR